MRSLFLNLYKMKTKLWILFLCLILVSCGTNNSKEETKILNTDKKIENTNQTKTNSWNKVWDNEIFPDTKSCWIITCALQNYLEKEELDWKFNLEKLQLFKDRFWSLVLRFKQKDILLKTPDYQKFVKDFHTEFFSWNSPYSYDEKNFIWYIFLPRMVDEEFTQKWWADEIDAESIVQSIKEKYYATLDEKEAIIQAYQDDLAQKAKKIDISKIDKKKLKEGKAYFEQIILTPSKWIYDKIFNDITTIIWPERWQLRKMTQFTAQTFFSKIWELWISKEDFYKNIWTSEDNFKKLNDKIEEMDKKYSLKQKIPSDRYIRHDEVVNYIFSNIWDFNKNWDFNKDVLELRHYTLLQYSYPDEKLYSMPERVAKFNSINNFMAEDLYKYSKSLNNIQF